MPRSTQQNETIRLARREQILDAALRAYIRLGYHGTDMDVVAEQAHLAKGLVYYYFKTKQDLFAALFTRMFDRGVALSDALLARSAALPPVDRLMAYVGGMFEANRGDPCMMPFFLRVPFDAVAVFGPDRWRSGAESSERHLRAITAIIQEGMACGDIPRADPARAANSFWTVFVANAFAYSRLLLGEEQAAMAGDDALRDVVRFGFQGLGIPAAIWEPCLDRWIERTKGEEPPNAQIP